MAEQSNANQGRWPIDFPMGWMAVRAIQTFFLVVLAHSAYLDRKAADNFDLISELIILVAVFAFFRRYATGEMDSEGIYYRRYLLSKRVRWHEIQEIQWRGSRLIFILKDKNIFARRLDFVLNPATSKIPYFRHRHDLDTPLPPVLERIHAFAGDALQIVSAPSQSRWIVRLFTSLVVLLLTIMLVRILLTAF